MTRLQASLANPLPSAVGWVMTVALTLVAFALRLINLGTPRTLVFDETYYVKEAYSLWQFGTERKWPDDPNPAFEAGDPSVILAAEPAYVVHPPLGKWILALGQMIFGQESSFGWRFSAALFGALSIFILIRLAIRLFRSVWLGFVAGVLLTVDGAHFVHSRTGLLDLFLMFFVLLGFWWLVIDRDRARARIEYLATTSGLIPPRIAHVRSTASTTPSTSLLDFGPALGWRPWRFAAGIALGCAMGVKWSGLYALAVFGIMIVLWDVRNRQHIGSRRPWLGMLRRDAVPAFLSLVPIAFVVYVLCWSGWIFSSGGYYRNWAAENSGWWDFLPDWLVSLAKYHYSAYQFHVGLDSEHTYMSNPWGWIVQWRPTNFYYKSFQNSQNGCLEDKCSAAINSVGNPVLWGLAALAVIVTIAMWILRRDWRAGAILAGLAATWLPWFMYQDRTIFTFYTIVMVPFVALAVTYGLGLLWGGWNGQPASPKTAASAKSIVARRLSVGVVLTLAVLAFAFFWPIYTAEVIPYDSWRLRILNPSWI